MIAVITCFCEHESLRPLTIRKPTALPPLLDKPLLEHWIEICVESGIEDVHVVLVDNPRAVEEFLGDGALWGCAATTSVFKDPCSSEEVVARLSGRLGGTLLVVPAETVMGIDLRGLAEFHRNHGQGVTRVAATSSRELRDPAPEAATGKPQASSDDNTVKTGVIAADSGCGSHACIHHFLY